MNILIVEDDKTTSEVIAKGVEKAGFHAVCAFDGMEGFSVAENTPCDLAVIDVMLPKMNGIELVKRLRISKQMFPIIILSAKSDEEDKIKGLEAGADDSLSKPFSLAELIARIHAQLRRAKNVSEPTELVLEDLRINVISRRVFRGNERIFLQPLEYLLLLYLLRNKGQVVSKTTIMEHVWEYHFDPHTNIVESRMSRLRDKIDKPYERKFIHTVRGFGYVLE